MLFNSPIFLFGFAPIFFLGFLLLPRPLRNPFIIFASIFFYAWGEPLFIAIVLGSTLLDWFLGNAIFSSQNAARKKFFLWVGIFANLAILIYFKYAAFL